ncbi:MAG: hypothetical protein KAJ25_15960 [Desulfobacula sp.]|nr:hypothetical protein [Desulfobacula sp.]
MIEKTVFKIIELIAGNTDQIFAFVNDLKTKYPKLDNDKLAKKVANKVKKKCAIQLGKNGYKPVRQGYQINY